MRKFTLCAFADEADPTVAGQIAALQDNDIPLIELRGVEGRNVTDLSNDEMKALRRRLEGEGIRIWSIGSPIGKVKLTDDFTAHLDTFRHTLEVADILGAKNLRLFSFYMPKGEDPTPYRNEVIERMGRFLEIGRDSGIALCHENEKGIYGDMATRCLELHQAFPELYGIFDPANFVQCGQDTLEAWELLKPYVRYMHIKDAMPDGSVVPAGSGAGNVPFIVGQYLAQGGEAFTLEPHLKVFDGLKALEEDGNTSVVGRVVYPDADTAFDVACNALKDILKGV